jgi:hypothetical protein
MKKEKVHRLVRTSLGILVLFGTGFPFGALLAKILS